MIRRPPRSTLFPTRRSSDLSPTRRPPPPPPPVVVAPEPPPPPPPPPDVALFGIVMEDRKSTRLNSSHANISYAVFCLKKKKKIGLGRAEPLREHLRLYITEP